MSVPVVLIFDRFDAGVMMRAKTQGELRFLSAEDWQRSPGDASEVEAVILRSGTQVYSKWLSQFPNLKLIQTGTSGFDHIDLDACRAKSIRVAHVPDAPVQAVA